MFQHQKQQKGPKNRAFFQSFYDLRGFKTAPEGATPSESHFKKIISCGQIISPAGSSF